MLKEIFYDRLKCRNLQGFVWKTTHPRLGGRGCFSHTNPSNFWWPLQSPLLRHTDGRLLFTGYLISISSFSPY